MSVTASVTSRAKKALTLYAAAKKVKTGDNGSDGNNVFAAG